MKATLQLLAWAIVTLVIIYTCIHPERGVLYSNPLACLGLGLIGLGVCVEYHRSRHAAM